MAEDKAKESSELVPTDVDELTHAELMLLYRESADSVRFAKSQQWKTLGTTLLVFGALILIQKYYNYNLWFMKAMFTTVILVTGAAIYALVIYQVWQYTEREKIAKIASRFSTLAREIRAIKSERESNVFRYILLLFLIGGVLIGGLVSLVIYAPYVKSVS